MPMGVPVTYKVTSVNATIDYSPQGVATPGKTVKFEMSTGYQGSIFVPDTAFSNTAGVRARLEQEVALIGAASQITGTVTG